MDLAEASLALDEARQTPTKESFNMALETCTYWLLEQPGPAHYFCHRLQSNPAQIDAAFEVAAFCLRLAEFKMKDHVLTWRNNVDKILNECVDCVEGYQRAKELVASKFLVLLGQDDRYRQSMIVKEHSAILVHLTENQDSGISAPFLHHILSQPAHYNSGEVLKLLKQQDIMPPLQKGPHVPAGVLEWTFYQDDFFRSYALGQLKTLATIKADRLKAHTYIYDALLRIYALVYSHSSNPETKFTTDESLLWQSFAAILAKFDKQVITGPVLHNTGASERDPKGSSCSDLVRLVCAHLGDRGHHYPHVLTAFTTILTTCGTSTWSATDLAFPGVVQHTIIDNPALQDSADEGRDIFHWQIPFLKSIPGESNVYRPYCSAALNWLFGRLQAIRFPVQLRAAAQNEAVKLLENVFFPVSDINTNKEDSWREENLLMLDVYSSKITEVAFSAPFAYVPLTQDEENPVYQQKIADRIHWAPVSKSARVLVERLLLRDSDRYLSFVDATLADIKALHNGKPKKDRPLNLRMCTILWDSMIGVIGNASEIGKLAAMDIIIRLAARTAHIDEPSTQSWLAHVKTVGDAFIPHVKMAQTAYTSCFSPLNTLIRELADSGPRKVQAVLSQRQISAYPVRCLLSPNKELHQAMTAVVNEAYDVTSRTDVFRALLEKLPLPSLEGISVGLGHFQRVAQDWPDAVSAAQQIARCLNSISDALCDSRDGLLRVAAWITSSQVQTAITKLWDLECQTLSVIFVRTPYWAIFHENHKMTAWMRDVLNFGTLLTKEVRAYEAAVRGAVAQEASPAKLSRAGTHLVGRLAPTMESCLTWLRLNDAETLQSTTELLRRMMNRFSKAKVALPPEVLRKLRKHATKTSSTGLNKRQMSLLITTVQSHPLHAEDFADVRVEADLPEPPRKTASSDQSKAVSSVPIDISDYEPENTRKRKQPEPSKAASTLPYKGVPTISAPNKIIKKPVAVGVQAKSTVPAKTNIKFGQAPMRNAPRLSYSHAKMRAALNAESSSDEDEVKERPADKLFGQTAKVRKVDGERRHVKHYDDGQSTSRAGGRNVLAPRPQQQPRQAVLARSAPDFSQLYRVILQWDYKHTGAVPAYTQAKATKSLPQIYDSAKSYCDLMQPMLLLECWQQLQAARDDQASIIDHTRDFIVSGRQNIDDFVDIFFSLKTGEKLSDKWYYTDADLVAISQNNCYILGKIHSSQRKGETLNLHVRCHVSLDAGKSDGLLGTRTEASVTKVMSMSTVLREYAALQSLQYLDLADDILRPRLRSRPDFDKRAVADLRSIYRLNEPQAMAVSHALDQDGFTLIQGPPGTGKTSTILALVGTLCSKRKAGNSASPGRLLVCAPSNAAVDEIARRLKDGIRDDSGAHMVPNVVRIGAESAVNIAVRDLHLDDLVDKAMGAGEGQSNDALTRQISACRLHLDALKAARLIKQGELDAATDPTIAGTLQSDLKTIRRDVQQKTAELQEARDKQQQTSRAMDVSRKKARVDVLSNADVICATLSGAGHDYLLTLPFDFDVVIIDEAAQAVELSSLIPLKYGCKQCVMVGDPQQLPPTVLSRLASDAGYDKSFFSRLQESNPSAVQLLSIQYRMHPKISAFPSNAFYQSRLADGPGMADSTLQTWHSERLFPPFAFMHVKNSKEEKRNHSIINRAEINAISALYKSLRSYFDENAPPTVGVIATYRAQLVELRSEFRRTYGQQIMASIDFNTVDGFQGQEKDVIIVSCVRGGPSDAGIGFLSDERRMNVAITRARSNLFVLGDKNALRTNKRWNSFVEHAEANKVLFEVSPSDFVIKSKSAAAATPKPKTTPPRMPKTAAQSPLPKGLARPKDISGARPKDAGPSSINGKAVYTRPEKRKASMEDLRETPMQVPPHPIYPSLPVRPEPAQARASTSNQFHQIPHRPQNTQQNQPQLPAKPIVRRPPAAPSLFVPKKARR